jgi:uncharacterized protein YndB with AHSA1/START domain
VRPDDYLKRTEVRIQRSFDATPAEVFRAWTDPPLMSRWMWAGLGSDVWAESDLRVGGAYRVYSKLPGGRDQGADWSGMCGQWVEIVPDRKLIYTVHWDADVFYNAEGRLTLDEVVVVLFQSEGSGTSIDFSHLGIPDDGQSVGPHHAGISQSFDLLAAMLAESAADS